MLICACLLAALVGLQLGHWHSLQTGFELFDSKIYVALLLVTPPAFFFFSREILMPDSPRSMVQLVHLLPVALTFFLRANLVIPVALAIGAGYTIWFVRVVFGLRRHVRRFKFEVFFFTFFALLAVLVLILGIASPYIASSVFYMAYANFTGIAFVLIMTALIGFPELLSDISAAAELAYAKSTLNDVDVDDKLNRLDALMREDKLFQNENLNLTLVAEALELTPHQLSELINTKFGQGFSRYVREQRVAEAKRLLRDDRKSSILSISLMIGFRSQSNFYVAFRDVTGQSPGDYRNNPQ